MADGPVRIAGLSMLPSGNPERHASEPAEVSCEMALIRKPGADRDFRQRQFGIAQHAFDLLEAALQ